MESMKNELTSWNDTIQRDKMPQDPVEFSFWVAGNLPLDDAMKLHLLQVDNAVQRLRCELSIMKKVCKYRHLLVPVCCETSIVYFGKTSENILFSPKHADSLLVTSLCQLHSW
jgi:cereblon